MPLRKPEDMSLIRWAVHGFDVKSLVLAVGFVLSAHYLQTNRISLLEQSNATLIKRADAQRDQIQELRDQKLDLSTYHADQQILQNEQRNIQDGIGRIETILMQAREK